MISVQFFIANMYQPLICYFNSYLPFTHILQQKILTTNWRQMNQVKRTVEYKFQIRKVPLKRLLPDKTPQLCALDVHSIRMPSTEKQRQKWASLHGQKYNLGYKNYCYEEDFNQRIRSSAVYKELYNEYVKRRDQRNKEKLQLMKEIDLLDCKIKAKKPEKSRIKQIKDKVNREIEVLRGTLSDQRDHNYNLRWEVYNQRGASYANLYSYSFLENNQLTYQQLIQMQERMGSVNRGLTLQQIEQLDHKLYNAVEFGNQEREICCICYDQIQDDEWVTILRCRHTHHCDCIKDWLIKQKICPICKKQVFVEQVGQGQENQQQNMQEYDSIQEMGATQHQLSQ